MTMRKLLALIMACAMIIAVFAGCGNSKDTGSSSDATSEDATSEENETSDNESEATEDSESPADNTGSTITIGLVQNPLTTDYDDNYLTHYIEDHTGINLEFFFFPQGEEAKQKFSMMTAGGETLPDIVCLGLSDKERYDYGSGGYFIPLNDYIENSAPNWNHMMDTWATPQQKANLISDATSYDGNIYAFPRFYCDPADAVALYMSVNTKFLENVNLEIPETTDELYTVLKAFKEQDANGNGDTNDEIPMMGHKGWMGSVSTFLLNSFTYFAYSGDFGYQLTVEDGKLSAPFVTEDFRDGMRYIHQLVAEGLCSDLSFTQEDAEYRNILQAPNDQDSLVGVVVGHPSPLFGSGVARVMDYVGIPALAGPDGTKYAPFGYQGGSFNVYITSDCENPDEAFRLLDAMQEDDMSMTMRFGEQDMDWAWQEGESYYSAIGDDYQGIYTQTLGDRNVWTGENNIIWHDNTLNSLPPFLMGGTLATPFGDEYEEYKLRNLCYEVFPLRYNLHPEEMPIRITYNAEETDQIFDIQNSIQTYVNESITQFALGEKDIENDWESYLSELDSMGLAQYLEVSQTAYDRAHK